LSGKGANIVLKTCLYIFQKLLILKASGLNLSKIFHKPVNHSLVSVIHAIVLHCVFLSALVGRENQVQHIKLSLTVVMFAPDENN